MKYISLIKSAINKVLDKTIGVFEMVVLGIIVVSAVSYALAWQAPGGNPPTSNTDTPINTGSTGQAKSGGLILNTGGAPTGLIVQNGNVGIGTAGPMAKLELFSNAGTEVGLLIHQTGVRYWDFKLKPNDGNLYITDRSAARDRMVIDIFGNVGIGTMSPGAKLDVAGNINGERLCIEGYCRSSWLNKNPTPVYQCPGGDPDWRRNMCMNQLSTSSTCLMEPGDYQASCTFVGYLIAP